MAVTIEKSKSPKAKIVCGVIIAVIAAIIATVFICVGDAGGINPPNDTEYIEISDSQSLSEIAQALHEQKIIKYPMVFKLEAKLGKYDGHFQSGSAYIQKGMTYTDILDMLITPARNTQKIVVPVGCDVPELAKILEEAGLAASDEFYGALVPSEYNYSFLAELPERDDTLEGYLYPATYEIPVGMSAHDIVDLMLGTLDAKLTQTEYDAAANLGFTMDQVITLASLVERDTVIGADLNRVARVYINRFRKNVPIESRGSVQFIVGDRKSVLSIADTKAESGYNTFANAGLPVGPVCNPSIDTINAVLSYEETNDYYYAMMADGSQVFSPNYQTFLSELENREAAIEVDTDAILNIDDKL